MPKPLPQIDDDAVYEFTKGQCHALALVLHDLTGFPLVGLGPVDYHTKTPDHVAVLLPAGTALDIQGPGAEERWQSSYGFTPYQREEVEDFCNRDYSKPRLKTALPYAKAVLKKYRIKETV